MKGIVIPYDEATPLHLITVYSVDDICRHILKTSVESEDSLSSLLLIRPRIQSKQEHHAPSMISSSVQSSHDVSYPGLYVYYEVSSHLHNHHHHHPVESSMEDERSNNHQNNDSLDLTHASIPNIRATRFAMACGHWSVRLYGTVVLCTDGTVLLREENKIFGKNSPTAIQEQMKGTHVDSIVTTLYSEIVTAACHECSPDLRNYFLLPKPVPSSATTSTQQQQQPSGSISDWIGNAAQEQYHDVAVLNRLHSLMTSPHHDMDDDNNDDDGDNTDTDNDATEVVHIQQRSNHSGQQCDKRTEMVSSIPTIPPTSTSQKVTTTTTTVTTKLPLCYHCRKPAFTLCHQCNGVYFCNTNCQRQGYVSKNCTLVFVCRRNLVVAHNSIFQSVMYLVRALLQFTEF
jgi:hypothetical protein